MEQNSEQSVDILKADKLKELANESFKSREW